MEEKNVIARSEMEMSLGATWQSYAVQGGFASVRLPRYARNDIFLK
ncbi:MAG: hypothetical protein JWQ57_2584 [Mucilaginibacter sp.]|nr:hypothetical protein [Mucilaginibacter sp.]